jgi:hypothetical protein
MQDARTRPGAERPLRIRLDARAQRDIEPNVIRTHKWFVSLRCRVSRRIDNRQEKTRAQAASELEES